MSQPSVAAWRLSELCYALRRGASRKAALEARLSHPKFHEDPPLFATVQSQLGPCRNAKVSHRCFRSVLKLAGRSDGSIRWSNSAIAMVRDACR